MKCALVPDGPTRRQFIPWREGDEERGRFVIELSDEVYEWHRYDVELRHYRLRELFYVAVATDPRLAATNTKLEEAE